MDDDMLAGGLFLPAVPPAPLSSASAERESQTANAILHCQRILREYGWCKLEPPTQIAIVDLGLKCFTPSRQEKLERSLRNLGFPSDSYHFETIFAYGEPLLNGELSEEEHLLCKLTGKAAIDKLDSILASSPENPGGRQGEWHAAKGVRGIGTPRNPCVPEEIILSDGQAILQIEYHYYFSRLRKMQQETPELFESLRVYLDERGEKFSAPVPDALVTALVAYDLAPEGVVNQNFLRVASLSLQRNQQTQKAELHPPIDYPKTERHQRLMSLFGKDCETPDR